MFLVNHCCNSATVDSKEGSTDITATSSVRRRHLGSNCKNRLRARSAAIVRFSEVVPPYTTNTNGIYYARCAPLIPNRFRCHLGLIRRRGVVELMSRMEGVCRRMAQGLRRVVRVLVVGLGCPGGHFRGERRRRAGGGFRVELSGRLDVHADKLAVDERRGRGGSCHGCRGWRCCGCGCCCGRRRVRG